jgi:hypothetical protein
MFVCVERSGDFRLACNQGIPRVLHHEVEFALARRKVGGFEFEAGVESASVMYTARVGIGEDLNVS